MSLFQISTAAHLAGSLILALFFVLLARHDPRPYLRDWTAAWLAQVLALAFLLLSTLGGGRVSLGLSLLLQAVHGLLLCAAALNYGRGHGLRRAHVVGFLPVAIACGLAPFLIRGKWGVFTAQFAVLALTYLAAAAILWPLREPGAMGLRITTSVLGLLGLLFLQHATVFATARRFDPESTLYFEVAAFPVLFLQTLLGLGMVLAVMEAAQWALATTNQQLTEAEHRLKVLAETDPLTGCFNRRVFRDLVDELRADRNREGVVLLLDMDDLKTLNDRQGHNAGDEAIRGVAEAIRSRTRTTDIVVRWGGDEFVVVVPGATRAEGESRRELVAAALAEAGLSVSLGLAAYGPSVDMMAAVSEADQAMYRAKAERKQRALGT